MSFGRPSTLDPAKTPWEALKKEKFDGARCCFGQLFWYRLKSPGQRTFNAHGSWLVFGVAYRPRASAPKVFLKVMDYQSFRANGAVTVHDVPEPELFIEEGDPVFPIVAAAERAIRTGEGEVPEYSIRDVPFIPEGTPSPKTPYSLKTRSACVTVERILKFKVTPGCKACTGDTRTHPAECRKRFAVLVESEKEGEMAKKAAEEEVKKSLKTPDEAAATSAAKASSVDPPAHEPTKVTAEQDEEIVRALLGKPATS